MEMLKRIAALYEIEEPVRGKSATDRLSLRQAESKPLVADQMALPDEIGHFTRSLLAIRQSPATPECSHGGRQSGMAAQRCRWRSERVALCRSARRRRVG